MEALVANQMAGIMQVRDAATRDLMQRGGWRQRRSRQQPAIRRGEERVEGGLRAEP